MSYTPTTWSTGNTITASALNKIENGIANAGSAMIVSGAYSNNKYVLNKTFQELYDATLAGIPVYWVYQYGDLTDYVSNTYMCRLVHIHKYDDLYQVYFEFSEISTMGSSGTNRYAPARVYFSTNSASAYPEAVNPTIHTIYATNGSFNGN